MENKAILMDGAVGTSLWAKAEARGLEKVPVWRYNVECPEIITELIHEYIDAGAKLILTNTFGANGPAVKRSSDYNVKEVVGAGVRIAREAVAGTDVKVVMSAGPLSVLLEPYGDLTEEECRATYKEMLDAGVAEKPDVILLQTFMDVEMMRIATEVALTYGIPVWCAMSFEKRGRTMMGNTVEQIVETLEPMGIDAIGMNCSLGPDLALPVIREFREKTKLPLLFKPNAGKPITGADGTTVSDYTAEIFAKEVAPALEFCAYVGGCCGSDPAYIRALRAVKESR